MKIYLVWPILFLCATIRGMNPEESGRITPFVEPRMSVVFSTGPRRDISSPPRLPDRRGYASRRQLRATTSPRRLLAEREPHVSESATTLSLASSVFPLAHHFYSISAPAVHVPFSSSSQTAIGNLQADTSYVPELPLLLPKNGTLSTNDLQEIIKSLDARAKFHRQPLAQLDAQLKQDSLLDEQIKAELKSHADVLKPDLEREIEQKINADFVQAVHHICKFGDEVMLAKMLQYNTQAPINKEPVSAPAASAAAAVPSRVPLWSDDPLALVYYRHQKNHELRMKMLKVLCADPRSQFVDIVRQTADRADMNMQKLLAFMLQGDTGPIIDYVSFDSLYFYADDVDDLSSQPNCYTPEELKEYRQLLMKRKGFTPEHFLQAVKGHDSYMVKRMLYNATDEFFRQLEAPAIAPDQSAKSIFKQATEYAQENNWHAMSNLIAHSRNIRALLTEEECEEFAAIAKEQAGVHTQNIVTYLLNRQCGPQYAAHQKAYTHILARQRAQSAAQQRPERVKKVHKLDDQLDHDNNKKHKNDSN